MAFSAATYSEILRRAAVSQATPEGRLARCILTDPNWPYSASLATQQSRVAAQFGETLAKHNRAHGRQHDSTTNQTVVGEWYVQAGG